MKKSVFQIINEFESSFDPTTVSVTFKGDTFEVYPWLKPTIFSAIQRGDSPTSSNKSMRFQLKQLFSGWKFLKSPAQTIVFSNTLERRDLGSGVVDKLFEAITASPQLQEAKTIEAKMPSNFFPLSSYANQKVASRSILYMKELLRGKIQLRKLKIDGLEPIQKLIDEHELNIDCTSIVRRQLAQYLVMKNFLKKQKGLKYVFLSVSYTNFGLVIACKKAGIKVIEAQHGVINEQHYGYSYAYDPKQNQFPDHLLTFGTADATFIQEGRLAPFVKAVPVGSYVIQHYLDATIKPQNKTVAISGQDCATGIDAVNTFIDLAKRMPDLTFYFKRRRMDRAFYDAKYTFPPNWIFEEEKDVYELILSCDVHLTAYSSCAIEAPSLGRRNLLFNLNNKAEAYYKDKLIKGNVNRYCESVDEMEFALKSAFSEEISVEAIQKSNAKNIQSDYNIHLDAFVQNLSKG